MNPERLKAALLDLDVPCQEPSLKNLLTLDDFKRIARQPSEAEQWIQMVPLAGLMARCFGAQDIDDVVVLSELSKGLDLFRVLVETMINDKLTKLREQYQKMKGMSDDPGNLKFGTGRHKIKGGHADHVYGGLQDRVGKCVSIEFVFML